MPFALLITGIVALIAGGTGKSSQLTTLLKGDLTGQNNYFYWMLAILAIGSIGYVDDLRPLSRAFLVLVIVGLIVRNGGFFTMFSNAITTITGQTSTTTGSN